MLYPASMARDLTPLLLLAFGMAALAGCSRTYDGTVVPTYQMTFDRYAGIPVLAMRRTPLEEPRVAMEAEDALTVFPPAPPPPPAVSAPLRVSDAVARPRRVRAAVQKSQKLEKTLVCQERPTAERPVSVVCE